MTPFYFGTRQHRLFGIYEAARQSGAHAAVLCYPFGAEYVSAHRSMRQLATLLTVAGYHVLRFDYYGTGNSAGEMTDASLCDWISDIRMAADEVRSITNSSRITLVGLRLGATLAAMAVAALGEIDALVLWDPVMSGPDYLDELGVDYEPAHGRRDGRSPVMDHGYQVGGFPLTFAMSRHIATLDLAALAPSLPKRTFTVACDDHPSHAAWRSASRQQAPVMPIMEYVPSSPAWIEWPIGHVNAGTIPVKMLQRIVECLT